MILSAAFSPQDCVCHFLVSHINNQKCQLGNDGINNYTLFCYWLRRMMPVTPASNYGIHTWTGNVQFHSSAHAAVVEEENTTIYLEQDSAAFIALAEVSHHSRELSGSYSLAH